MFSGKYHDGFIGFPRHAICCQNATVCSKVTYRNQILCCRTMVVTMLLEFLYSLLYPAALWLFCISLWKYYINNLKDKSSELPLPPGTVGLPFIGETVQMVFQVRIYKSGHMYQ